MHSDIMIKFGSNTNQAMDFTCHWIDDDFAWKLNNQSKFRSDNSRTRIDMKSHFFRPHLLAAKNANSHKSTFNSKVSFIKLSKDRNIWYFAKANLSDFNYNGQKKHSRLKLFSWPFFHLEVEKYSTAKWGKHHFWYYPRKNFWQTSTNFDVTGLLPNKIVFIIATPCIIK